MSFDTITTKVEDFITRKEACQTNIQWNSQNEYPMLRRSPQNRYESSFFKEKKNTCLHRIQLLTETVTLLMVINPEKNYTSNGKKKRYRDTVIFLFYCKVST